MMTLRRLICLALCLMLVPLAVPAEADINPKGL